jgi:hypothetical protein
MRDEAAHRRVFDVRTSQHKGVLVRNASAALIQELAAKKVRQALRGAASHVALPARRASPRPNVAHDERLSEYTSIPNASRQQRLQRLPGPTLASGAHPGEPVAMATVACLSQLAFPRLVQRKRCGHGRGRRHRRTCSSAYSNSRVSRTIAAWKLTNSWQRFTPGSLRTPLAMLAASA